jgi:urease accessory protein
VVRISTPTDGGTLRLPALLRLCHLVSPALPIGAYAWSQGLEYAVHAGWVSSEQDALEWLSGLARNALGTLDVPVLLRLHAAWSLDDAAAAQHWSELLLAARDAAELRSEDRHMGAALARVLQGLEPALAQRLAPALLTQSVPLASAFALAAVHWQIRPAETAAGYLWAWSENQVLAAVKLVPLGQSAGQRLLHVLIELLPQIVARAETLADEDIGSSGVLQGLAAACHEQQYSRLFRS